MINVLRLQCDGCAMLDTANVYKSRDEKHKYKQLTLSSLVFRHSHRSVFDRVLCTYCNYCLIDGTGLETSPYRLHDEPTDMMHELTDMASVSIAYRRFCCNWIYFFITQGLWQVCVRWNLRCLRLQLVQEIVDVLDGRFKCLQLGRILTHSVLPNCTLQQLVSMVDVLYPHLLPSILLDTFLAHHGCASPFGACFVSPSFVSASLACTNDTL